MNTMAQELVDSVDEVVRDGRLSEQIIRQILRDFGGMQVYLPVEHLAFKEEIAREIYDMWDGGNVRQVCRAFRINFSSLYSTIRAERNRRQGEQRKRLPGKPGV